MSPDEAKKLLGEARMLYHCGDWTGALALCEQVIAANPSRDLTFQAKFRKGRCLFRMRDKDPGLAEQYFQDLINEYPGVIKLKLYYGRCLFASRKPLKAIEQIITGIVLDKSDAESCYLAGLFFLEYKQYEYAKCYFKMALDIDPALEANVNFAFWELTKKALADKNFKGAFQLCMVVAEHNPDLFLLNINTSKLCKVTLTLIAIAMFANAGFSQTMATAVRIFEMTISAIVCFFSLYLPKDWTEMKITHTSIFVKRQSPLQDT